MKDEGHDLYRAGLFNASITGLAMPVASAQSAANYVLNYAHECNRMTDGDALVIEQEADRLAKAVATLRKAASLARQSAGADKPERSRFLQAAE
jgi:hypothetical protein